MKRTVRILSVMLCLLFALGSLSAGADTGITFAPLAQADTTLSGSSNEKLHNLMLACNALNGYSLEMGETFSFNYVIGERSEMEGYVNAMNGRGAKVRGGGVAQLATTLFLALKGTNLVSIGQYQTYGKRFKDNYVSDGSLAIITDYGNDIDFTFTSRYPGVLRFYAEIRGGRLYVSVEEGAILRPSEAYVTESSYPLNNDPVVNGEKAFDLNTSTAWNVRNNDGVGEWVRIAVRDNTARTFTGFSILNGYCKSTDRHGTWDRWKSNSRVRSMDVYCDNTYVMTVTLQDIHSWQTITFPHSVTGRSLRFEINSSYRGRKYTDVCISEFKIYCE